MQKKSPGFVLGSLALLLASWPALVQAQNAPTVVFRENFENGLSASTVAGMTASNIGTGGGTAATTYNITGVTPIYTSAPFPLGGGSTRYTAAVDWLDGAHCDGLILSQAATTQPSWIPTTANGCNTASNTRSYGGARTVALGIGGFMSNGGVSATYTSLAAMPAGSTSNHSVSAFTECPTGGCTRTIGSGTGGGADGLMLRNLTAIPVASANRYYTASVVVGATSCNFVDPVYQLRLQGLSVGSVNPCTATGSALIRVPNQQGGAAAGFVDQNAVRVARILAPNPLKVATSSLTVEMYSLVGGTNGNDAGFDDLQILDVTPSLTKAFTPGTVAAGDIAQITFTITNTTDNLAKPGWEFTDNLSAGLTLANTTVGGTCRNYANTASPADLVGSAGSGSFTIRGSLPAQVSCTVTVNVRVSATVTTPILQNCGSNISSAQYVVPPAAGTCATLNVTRPVSLTKTWQGATTGNAVSLTISGSSVSSNTAGTSTAPSTTTAATAQALLGSTVNVAEAFTSGSAGSYATTLTCARASDGAALAVTGTGLNRSFTMPGDSAVNCTFTNDATPPTLGTCPVDAYITRGVGGTTSLYTLDLVTGAMTDRGTDPDMNAVNGIGFRQQDGLIYGWSNGVDGTPRLLQIGAGGVASFPYATAPSGLPVGLTFFVADVQPSTGYYVGFNGATLYFIDVTTNAVVRTVGGVGALGASTDMAFNPIDGNLYSVNNNTGAVIRINPTTGAVTNVGISLPLSGSGGWGGIFFDNQGTMYAYKSSSAAGTGQVFRVFSVAGGGTLTYDLLTDDALTATNLDGARCPQAPPQGGPAILLRKTTLGAAAGAGPFQFTLNNTEETSGTATTTADNTPVQVDGNSVANGVQSFTVRNAALGQPLTITESALPVGWSLASATCTRNGATVGALSGTTYTLPGADIAAGALFECTFTNRLIVADISISKTNTPGLNGGLDQAADTVTSGAVTTYNIVVSNAGPAGADGAIAKDVPAAGLTGCSVAQPAGCAAAGGAICPTSPGNLLTANGVAIPTLPSGGTVTFTVSCTVQ